MAENISDEVRELKEQLRDLKEIFGENTSHLRQSKEAQKEYNKNLSATNPLIKANAEAEKEAAKVQENYSKAVKNAEYALKAFHSAMVDTTEGFKKYEAGLESLSKATTNVLNNFGFLGKAAGLAVTALGKFAGAVLEQADNITKAYDDLAKVGGAAGLNADQIQQFGKQAGFSTHTLSKFTKAATESSDSLVAMGGSVGKGMKHFTEFTAVGDEALAQYRRLGMSQEDVLAAQTQYIKYQQQSGASLAKSPKELQKASLEYIDSLNKLADLTGASVKKQQEALDAAAANENWNAYKFDREREREEALKRGDKATADKIEAELKAKEEFIRGTANYSQKTKTALLEAMATSDSPVITENTAKLKMQGHNLDDIVANLNKGNSQVTRFNRDNAEAQERYRKQMGENAYRLGKASRDNQEAFGIDNEGRREAMKYQKSLTEQGRKELEAQEKLTGQQIQQKKEAGQAGQSIIDEQAKRAELERKYRTRLDEALAQIRPAVLGALAKSLEVMAKGMELLAKVLPKVINFVEKFGKEIAIAVGALYGLKMLKGAFNKLKDMMGFGPKQLGTAGNPMHVVQGAGAQPQQSFKEKVKEKIFGKKATPEVPVATVPTTAAGTRIARRERVAELRAEKARAAGENWRDMEALHGKKSTEATAAGDSYSKAIEKRQESERRLRAEQLKRGTPTAAPMAKLPPVGPTKGVEGMMETAGKGNGNFLEAAAKGLSAFANPKVILGAAGFGTAIALVGAGIAGATWIISKALPSLAEGLAPFQDLDGEKLISTGKGIGALGAGLAVFGAGGAAAGIGSIIGNMTEGLVKMFGGKTPFDKLEEFSRLDIDPDKVKKNSEAMLAFSKAMGALGAGTAMTGVGAWISAFGDGMSKLFGVDLPLDKFKKFSNEDFGDPKKVKANAEALGAFGEAMTKMGTGSIASGIGAWFSAFGEGLSKLFGVSLPYDKVKQFGLIDLGDTKKIKANAEAIGAFGDAMTKMGTGSFASGIGSWFSAFGDGISSLFKVKLPLDKFKEFSQLDLGDPKKIIANAEALGAFGDAMGKMGTGSITSGLGSWFNAFGEGLSSLFKVQLPLDKFKAFANADLGDPKKVKANAEALAAYGDALGSLGKGAMVSGVGSYITALGDGLSSLFKVQLPLDKFKDFANANLGDPQKVKANAEALGAFGEALGTLGKGAITSGIGSYVQAIGEGLSNLLGVDSPIEKFQKFADLKLGNKVEDIKKNAEAFTSFATAMSVYKGGAVDSITSSISSAVANFFEVDSPLDKFRTFAHIEIGDPKVVQQNADAFVAFSNAIKTYQGESTSVLSSVSQGLAKSVESFFDVDPPFKKFLEFSNLPIGPNVSANAKAFVDFASALSKSGLAGSAGILKTISGGIAESIGEMFGKKDVIDKFKDFTKLDIDPDRAGKVAEAFKKYVDAMVLSSTVPQGIQSTAARAMQQAAGGGAGGGAPTARGASRPGSSGSSTSGSAGSSAPSGAPGGSHSDSGASSSSSSESGKTGKVSEIDGLKQAQEAGLKLRPYGDVAFKGMTETGLSAAKQIQEAVPGFMFYTGLNDEYHAKVHPNSKHAIGQGMDFNVGGFPTPDQAQAIVDRVKNISGISLIKDEYYYPPGKGNPSRPGGGRDTNTTGPHFHAQVSAASEGIAQGPTTGYPATLHGNELIKRITKDSILDKLAHTPFQEASQPIVNDNSELTSILGEMKQLYEKTYSLLDDKLTAMVDNLEDSVDVQENIYKLTMN